MVQQGQIDHLLQETGQIEPPDFLVRQAFLQDYEGQYRDSMESPEGFWEGVASELEWTQRWDSVFQWDYPTFRWFLGAKCNITQNALDRHLTNGNRNKAAFIWLGEDGTERVFTYGRLAQLVNRFANGLRSLGVGKGDRVVIYMPLTPEGAIAMLACARIGAVHSVVYAGFSSGSLRDRILDAQAKVVITADVGYRRGNEVDLLGITERAVEELDIVETVVVWRRKSHPHPNPPPEGEGTGSLGGREVDFDALMAESSVDCDAEEMDSEDPLYILYTSGTTGRPKGVQHVHGGYMVGTYYHFKNFWDVKDDDVFWCTSDIGWVVGHSYIVYAPLVAGGDHHLPGGSPGLPTPWRLLRNHREVRGQRHLHRAHGPADADALRRGLPEAVRPALAAVPDLRRRAAEPGGAAVELRAHLRQRRVGAHRGQLVADGDGGAMPGHHGHDAGEAGPGGDVPCPARKMDIVDREGPAHHGAGQGRAAGHQASLPSFLPHGVSATRSGTPGTGTRYRASTSPATWPCAMPTGTTWWWAAPTTC